MHRLRLQRRSLRAMGSYKFPDTLADRTGSQICHCEGASRPWQSREGSYVFAGSTQLSGQVLRDSHVASLLGMTRQASAAVHQCTCAVELPSARCSGNAAAFPIGAISRFLRKKIPEAQASGSFSITINHNQLFTSRRPSSGGRSGAGRPHSPEPSGPRAAACSNR